MNVRSPDSWLPEQKRWGFQHVLETNTERMKMQWFWFLHILTMKIEIRHEKKYFTMRVVKHWDHLLKEAVDSAHYSFFTASSSEQPLKLVLPSRRSRWPWGFPTSLNYYMNVALTFRAQIQIQSNVLSKLKERSHSQLNAKSTMCLKSVSSFLDPTLPKLLLVE